MSKLKDAKTRKQAQRARQSALGITRMEVRMSERERQQLNHLRIVRAGSGEPYSSDEYISTLIRRDWERWVSQVTISKCRYVSIATTLYLSGAMGRLKGNSHAGRLPEIKPLHCSQRVLRKAPM